MAPANFWTEKKKRHGAALSLEGTRGTVQVFERQGVQVFDLIRSGSKFVTGIPFGFYADSCKHLNRASFCTVCAVKAWCLVSAFDKKYNK